MSAQQYRRSQCGEWSKSGPLPRRCMLEVSHAGEHVFGERPAEPRTWSLPPEPGPEVTAVRDAEGAVWRLHDDGAWHYLAARRAWGSLLADFGPLADATEEQP